MNKTELHEYKEQIRINLVNKQAKLYGAISIKRADIAERLFNKKWFDVKNAKMIIKLSSELLCLCNELEIIENDPGITIND